MFCLIDKDKTGSVSVEAVMNFIAEITLQRYGILFLLNEHLVLEINLPELNLGDKM